jgi:hypothetical protein
MTARKARQSAAKRNSREKQLLETFDPQTQPMAQDSDPDVLAILDEELSRLPDKYRIAILLSDLHGHTRTEVARRLGIPEGTVASRLSRGRQMLATKLRRRGAAVPDTWLAVALAQPMTTGSVPDPLLAATMLAGAAMTAGKPAAGWAVSAQVLALTRRVVNSMTFAKWKAKAFVVLALLLLFPIGYALVSKDASVAIDPEKYGSKIGAKSFARNSIMGKKGSNRELLPATFDAQFDRLKNEWRVVVGMRIDTAPLLQKDTCMVLKYNPSTRTYTVVSDDWNLKAFAFPLDGVSEINGWRKVQPKDIQTWAMCQFIKPATATSPVSSGCLVTQIPADTRNPEHADQPDLQVRKAGKWVTREFGSNALTANVTPRGVTILAQDTNQKQWVCEFGAPEGRFLEAREYGFIEPPPSFYLSGPSGLFPYSGIRYKAEGMAWGDKWRTDGDDFVVWEIEVKEQKVVRLAIDFSSGGASESDPLRSISGSLRFNSHFELSKEVPRPIAP